MNDAKVRIDDLVRVMADVQTQLLDALHAQCPAVAQGNPTKWPRRIELVVDGVAWRGAGHGMGYRFESEERGVVEAHDCIQERPYPIDAYRISVYAQSVGVTAVVGQDGAVVDPEPEEIEPLLIPLEQSGILVRDARAKLYHRYVVVET